MEHPKVLTSAELETYARTIGSESVIPELVWSLVNELTDLAMCRIPYGDKVNQPGWDGLVETAGGFRQFVPPNKSYWEIGTGASPQKKATKDFITRTKGMPLEERQQASFVFVTPRGSGSGGWTEPMQRRWLKRMGNFGWKNVKILDADQLADWIREYPSIGRWLLQKMGLVKNAGGFSTPREHWENLEQFSRSGEPRLPSKLFLTGRNKACAELERLFKGESNQLVLAIESEVDAEDFVAAYLASLPDEVRRAFSNHCVFVKDADAWHSLARLKAPHVLLAHPNLDLLGPSGEQLHLSASKSGHSIIIPVFGTWKAGGTASLPLPSPSAPIIETVLNERGYKHDRARVMAEAAAGSLARLKRHLRGLGDLPPYAEWKSARTLAEAGLFGRWFGENDGDKSVIADVVGKSYGEWIDGVRPETLRPDTPITQRNEHWKVMSRGEAWLALAPRLANEDLDRFRSAARTVFNEVDPRFDISPDERFTASFPRLRHSADLRQGMAETLSLMGSKSKALTNCSIQKGEITAILTVRDLLKGANWRIWATLDEHLPMLAEAAPDEFLDAVELALEDPAASPFNQVFAQERSSIMGSNHMSGLLWALETLAWDSKHLLRVSMYFAELAEIDPGGTWTNRPSNSLLAIFLPWHRQTCAPFQKRKAVLEALISQHSSIGWKLLLDLLPTFHGITSGTRKPAWRDYIPTDWTERPKPEEYWQEVECYATLALQHAATSVPRLVELIQRLPDIPAPAHGLVLNHLESDPITALPEAERRPLWDGLLEVVAKHRKFPTAEWALPADAVNRIDEVAQKLAPSTPAFRLRRLFTERDFKLYEGTQDIHEQRVRLQDRRTEAVQELLNTSDFSGVLEFARTVSSPEKVGNALALIDSTVCDQHLPDLLAAEDTPVVAFTHGFIWGRFFNRGLQWVDSLPLMSWTTDQRVAFFANLPFRRETWIRAEAQLGEDSQRYWAAAKVNPWGLKDDAIEATEKLLHHGRPRAALACLSELVHSDVSFPPALAERALADSLDSAENPEVPDQHEVLEIISWLQDHPSANSEALFKIEWSYLPILDELHGGTPQTLGKRMAEDPAFFCELLRIAFRAEQDVAERKQPTESEVARARNAYRLFHAWRTIPGTLASGGFDEASFRSWLQEVKTRATESGHFRIAMDRIGQLLVYSPKDPAGLWIHRSIAEALNLKDAKEMRSAFTCGLFNLRGVHGFTGGAEESKIAKNYHQRAEDLEIAGFHRIATAVRELATNYERDAEREASSSPFED